MLQEGVNGFCMALADSVPGVSGGTVAFIMGFYDKFIGSINNLFFGKSRERKSAIGYLLKLGIGWVLGMSLAVLALSALFDRQIYVVSSLFIGFIAGSIPLIIRDERESFRQVKKGILFCVLGMLLVVGISWLNGMHGTGTGMNMDMTAAVSTAAAGAGNTGIAGSTAAIETAGRAGALQVRSAGGMDLSVFSFGQGIKLFLIGIVAISAMFLPGISGEKCASRTRA